MRLALVDVLVILAPLAALLWILPQTQNWGRLWGTLFVGTVFAQAVQVLALRLGFNLTTDIPPSTASGLIQPLLGIAVLALVLKIARLMRGGGGGGNLIGSLIGTATGAVIVGGASRMALGALGAARAGSAPGVARAARSSGGGAEYSLPMTVAVPSGSGSSQLSLAMSVPHQSSRQA
jgi:hypothetical protein